MNLLILNGAERDEDGTNQVSQLLESKLSNNEVNYELLELRKESIAACLGCFSCWFKTPGICIIDDLGRSLPEKLVKSDVVILVSPIIFGGYSPELKKALDRFLPYLDPDVMKINGEVHHKQRYNNQFNLVGVGINEDENEENAQIFKTLVERNSINFHCQNFVSLIIHGKESENEIYSHLDNMLKTLLGGEFTNA